MMVEDAGVLVEEDAAFADVAAFEVGDVFEDGSGATDATDTPLSHGMTAA
jgi:hypothetical protein